MTRSCQVFCTRNLLRSIQIQYNGGVGGAAVFFIPDVIVLVCAQG